MTIEFPKAKLLFTRNGHTITVAELISKKRIDYINQPEDDEIDTEFFLLGFETTFPEIEVY